MPPDMDKDKKAQQKLKLFTDHGVVLSGETDSQWIGTCPFTDKENKFYINKESFLWDSKTAGISGNPQQFLGYIADLNAKLITDDMKRALAKHRKLPVSAFHNWGIGYNGVEYTLPVRTPTGTVVDVRRYRLGGRVLATTGATVGLLGAHHLQKHPTWPVYICEGEWDTIALEWLRIEAGIECIVVGVPGAGVLKPEWAQWLTGRDVITLYDADEAGLAGEQTAIRRLKGSAQRLRHVHWPADVPDGFDTRDWVVDHRGDIESGAGPEVWRDLQALVRAVSRGAPAKTVAEGAADDGDDPAPAETPMLSAWALRAPSLADVIGVFEKWLFLRSTDAISIMLATAVSQQIDGEPIWMFLVGPPGSAKTETLNSLSNVPNVYMTSSLTPHSLISGANWKDGADPSLIPRLDGKIMIIKDFTSILSLRDTEKDEIFGILRDAYDGKCGKEFGNGVVRNYESRFTLLAAVTPSIYSLSSQHTALGERFLKFAISDNIAHDFEDDIISRAIDNIDAENRMRGELADVVQAYLARTVGTGHFKKDGLPTIPPAMKTRIISLARFGARMRGTVTRDTYRNDIVTSRPSAEVGSRLGKQLAKLTQSLAVVHRKSTVGEDEYRLVKKTMLDTIPQRNEDVLRHMLRACPTHDQKMSMQDLALATRYPLATVSRILQDMNVLDVVERTALTKGRHLWGVSQYMRDLIDKAQIYKKASSMKAKVRK